MSGHTPAPWEYDADNGHIVGKPHQHPRARKIVAYVCGYEGSLEADANGQILAAAPETAAELERAKADIAELVEVLKTVIADAQSGQCEVDILALGEAALAKHARAETSDG